VISRRWLVALAALLAVVLLPTIRHGYLGYVEPTAKISAASLPSALAGARGVRRSEPPTWMPETYSEDSWAEQSYDVAGVGTVTLFVARGYDLKKLYHHPELGVLRGRSFQPLRHETLAGGDEAVYVLENLTGEGESAVYALVYDGRWVGNPYMLQLSSALTSVWSARRPLTLVFAYGRILADGKPLPVVADLLRAAVRGMQSPDQSAGL
jgi:hypothetical protein